MIITNVSLYPNRDTYSMSLMSQQEPISAANGLLAAVWCNSYSCFQLSPGWTSLSNQTSRFDIEHSFDIDSFTYEGTTIRRVMQAASVIRIDNELRHRYEVIAPFRLNMGPISSLIRVVQIYVIESMSNCFGCVVHLQWSAQRVTPPHENSSAKYVVLLLGVNALR